MELGKRIALNIQRVARFSLTLGGEKLRLKVKKEKICHLSTLIQTQTQRERERNKRPRNKSTRNVFILFRVWEGEWAGKRRCCCNFICLFRVNTMAWSTPVCSLFCHYLFICLIHCCDCWVRVGSFIFLPVITGCSVLVS